MRNPYLGFQCCLEVGDDLWFSSFSGNGLFRMHEGKVEHILDFQEEKESPCLFADIKSYKGKLYFIPMAATKIYVYDPASGKMEGIPYESRGTREFVFSILYEHYLYIFPELYQGILKLDMDSYEIEIYDDWICEDFRKCQLSGDAYFRGDYVRKGSTVYLPFCNAHAVLEFCLECGSSTIHNVGIQAYATIVDAGKKFWMAPRSGGNIVSWDVVKGAIEEYGDFPRGFQQGAFLGSFYWDGHIWLFPETANMVLKVNLHTGEITEDTRFSDFCNCKVSKFSVWYCPFIYLKKNESEVLLCTGKSGEVVKFYPDKNEIRRFRLKLSEEDAQYYHPAVLDICIKNQRILIEYWGYTLKEYIKDIGDIDSEDRREQVDMVGRKIYQSIIYGIS